MAQAAKKRKRKKVNKAFSDELNPEFQVAPMADLLFVLLVFFMSITTVEVLRKENVNLPVAKDSIENKQKSHQIVVNVLWDPLKHDGSVKVDERIYATPEALVPLFTTQLAQDPTVRVLIRADKSSEYSFISQVMRSCSEAGVSDVTFAVLNKEDDSHHAAAPAATP